MVDVRKQPAKAVFLIYHAFSTLMVRLPLWTIIALVPALRPRKNWSVGRVIRVRLIEYVLSFRTKLGGIYPIPNHLAIAPGVHMKGVWIQPVPELILGRVQEWASDAKIEAIQIPGYWLHKTGEDVTPNASPSPGEKVVMALHGGAYVGMSANPDDHTSNIAKGILEYVHTVKRVFSVEYRLSKGPPFESANPFPTALVDALAGYNHLVNVVGFDPRDIILEGDSAGGNLVLALARYLVEYTGELQSVATKTGVKPLAPPAGLILLSPWPDLGTSHDRTPPSYLAKSDYVGNVRGPRAKYAQTAFTGSIGLAGADTNVYISPASKSIKDVSFAGWPRTFIVCGGAEYLVSAIGTLKERMAAHMGEGTGPGQVYYHEQPDAVHDYLCFPWHEPERSATLKAIAEWC